MSPSQFQFCKQTKIFQKLQKEEKIREIGENVTCQSTNLSDFTEKSLDTNFRKFFLIFFKRKSNQFKPKLQNGILLQSRNAWGNVNLPTKRGENRPNRHWNARHSKMRVAKEMKLKLPDVEKERKMSAEKDVTNQREEMKKRGILPVGPSSEYPVYMGCSPSVFDAFIPVRSDGIATQIKDITKKKGKSFRAVNKIRKYDHDFDVRNFPQEAEEVYIKAHTALANRRFKELHNYATELCYPVSFLIDFDFGIS